jgi:TonB family protein
MRYFTLILTIIFIIFKPVIAGDAIEFKIKVSIVSGEAYKETLGAGEFTVSENQYGRIAITFYENGHDFYIQPIGAIQKPVSFFIDYPDKTAEDDAAMMVDLYLQPSLNDNREIQISGIINTLAKSDKDARENLHYSASPIDLTIPNGGEYLLELKPKTSAQNHRLKISAYTSRDLGRESVSRGLDYYDTEYSLFNLDNNRYEIDAQQCRLLLYDEEQSGPGECVIKKSFKISRTKSIDYSITYQITDVMINDDDTYTFNFEVTREYKISPIKSGKKTTHKSVLRSFNKAVTTDLSEQLEIIIPQDKDSELPFKSLERITVKSPEKYIQLDEMPLIIYQEMPAYPKEAHEQGITAEVYIKAFIDKEGKVREARAVECNRPGYGFEEAAVNAAKKCRYDPGLQNERPVGVWVTYKVNFKLD